MGLAVNHEELHRQQEAHRARIARLSGEAPPLKKEAPTPEWMTEIIRVVCEYYSVPDHIVTERTRKAEAVLARQVVMYLADQLTENSLATVGKAIGRDASTVWHGARLIETEIAIDPEFSGQVSEMRAILIGG